MSTFQETRLSGRQANLAGITRAIHQHMGHGPLARVELRYSTQVQPPLQPDEARLAIANLLREHGQDAARVSVRAHEGPIADATGEHVLRLVPAETGARPPNTGAGTTGGGWRGLLARWGLTSAGKLTAGAAPAPGARVEPGLAGAAAQAPAAVRAQAPAVPAISAAAAVAQLRLAVAKAAAFVESPDGDLLAAKPAVQEGRTMGQAQVIVRHAALNTVLQPLVQRDHRAIGDMVRSAGLPLHPAFSVSYQYKPAQSGDGTGYAHETDLDVRLVLAAEGAAGAGAPAHKAGSQPKPIEPMPFSEAVPAVAPQTGAPTEGTACPAPEAWSRLQAGADGGTALPAPPAAPRRPALVVRVVGTCDGPFDRPFVLRFSSLPARLDRCALQLAGFGKVHPELLAVASNSCPLLVDADTAGAWKLHATPRPEGQQGPRAMYHRADTREPLLGDLTWSASAGAIIVNAPEGVLQPGTQRRLPALMMVLEVA